MPTAILARIRDGDPDFWRAATRSAPLVVQVVLAAVIGVVWLSFSSVPLSYGTAFRYLATAALIVPTAAALVIGTALLRAESPRRRGVGLAVCGSAVVTFISGLAYALIFVPWLETI
ncbi:hypothetical protein [Mycolicibacter longobardus]|uniref:Uncharacterized protein n=1 Tax=Mycolicibacter longobardus TaxID=1108812 RepID=A0A1X1YCI8_9MYCO|nr:hypothetical protein [Mycolicibacter longobardus]MCV7386352.1 hypothetical protein [Mycolicibacter longobardus]ORW08807.1 hypothetical protein AWC16_18470 [Mycolicibacter longobardus]